MKIYTLTLTRHEYYADCTIGTLTTEKGNIVCHTIEPACRMDDEQKPLGLTAIPEGEYALTAETDYATQRFIFRLGKVRSFARVYMRMDNEYEAFPYQTRCDILIGAKVNHSMGKLEDCLAAYTLLDMVREHCLATHANIRLRIKNEHFEGRSPRKFEPDNCETEDLENWDF